MAKILTKMAKKILQPQTFPVLAQTWHTGSLGQVQQKIIFVWTKNEKWPKYGQKQLKTAKNVRLGSNLATEAHFDKKFPWVQNFPAPFLYSREL